MFIVGVVVIFLKISELRRQKKEFLEKISTSKAKPVENERWELIVKKMNSDNSSDWKMAIVEADKIIDDVMKNIGHAGSDLGERLKSVEPSDFQNLQNVWDAHKIRNRIAHEANFEITKLDAKEVLDKYKKALQELKYV